MAGRPLSPEEARLWATVAGSVRAYRRVAAAAPSPAPSPTVQQPRPAPSPTRPIPRSAAPSPTSTLDAGWDRRLARGTVAVDRTVDLHGHTLGSAHALLDAALEGAIAAGDRVLLLVTGKPPRPDSLRPHGRGAIRASVGDWLAASRHTGRIAAVRNAHPRHGGQGALYIILRRPR